MMWFRLPRNEQRPFCLDPTTGYGQGVSSLLERLVLRAPPDQGFLVELKEYCTN